MERLKNKGMRRYNIEGMGHLSRIGPEGEREEIIKKMTKKMITTNIMVFIMAFSLIGCGNAVSALNEEDSDINSVSDNESLDDSGIDMDNEDIADVISDSPKADVVDEIIDEVVESSSFSENTVSAPTPVVEENPEPTPTPHVHQYVESITVQPTCAVAGEKIFTCECGDVRTESVPATGSHNWVEQTAVIHHDELGHVEQSRVLTGYTNPHTEYECPYCGYRADTPSAIVDHRYNSGDPVHAFSGTWAYDYPAEPIYETQSKWVVDQEAYDSVEIVGYQCSVCGATQ